MDTNFGRYEQPFWRRQTRAKVCLNTFSIERSRTTERFPVLPLHSFQREEVWLHPQHFPLLQNFTRYLFGIFRAQSPHRPSGPDQTGFGCQIEIPKEPSSVCSCNQVVGCSFGHPCNSKTRVHFARALVPLFPVECLNLSPNPNQNMFSQNFAPGRDRP